MKRAENDDLAMFLRLDAICVLGEKKKWTFFRVLLQTYIFPCTSVLVFKSGRKGITHIGWPRAQFYDLTFGRSSSNAYVFDVI